MGFRGVLVPWARSIKNASLLYKVEHKNNFPAINTAAASCKPYRFELTVRTARAVGVFSEPRALVCLTAAAVLLVRVLSRQKKKEDNIGGYVAADTISFLQ